MTFANLGAAIVVLAIVASAAGLWLAFNIIKGRVTQ